jgi:hypothetical protein
MKNGNLSTTQLKARVAQAIVPVVALEAGQQLLCHALLLESQCHHCIGTGQSLFKTAFNGDLSALSDGIARQTLAVGHQQTQQTPLATNC